MRRVLNLFENFAVAFCYISPVVGIYSLFVLGIGMDEIAEAEQLTRN